MRLTNKKVLVYSILLTVIVLSIIPLIRVVYFDSILSGSEPYYHARMANYVMDHGVPKTDPLVDRPYLFQPYHLILGAASKIIGIYSASLIIPYLFGLASVIFLYFIFKQFNFRPLKTFLIFLILILSPVFIYTFSMSTPYCISAFLLILGFYLFKKEKKTASIAIFSAAVLFSIFNLLVGIAILSIFSIHAKNKRKIFYPVLACMIIVALIFYAPFIYFHQLPEMININGSMIIMFVSELGGELGFNMFNILLALLGMYLIWKTKKQIFPYSLLALSVLLFFYFNQIGIYLNIIFAVFAGCGFYGLMKMKWTLKLIKKLTAFVLILSLLFSAGFYISRTAKSMPDEQIIGSLKWLRDGTNKEDTIFSHYNNGFWIEAVSQRQVILDDYYTYINSADMKFNNSNELFYSRNLDNTIEFLDKHGIKYIFITPEMKEGLVWNKEQEGLLFLFRNEKTFKRVYNEDGIEIWQYKLVKKS
ncbi:hypothetical protein KY317_03345 [Candidatus Woesearchaeota archaeon]|nr:hypothetical protein [Candidatus Woesearchaeota archaeon]